MRLLTAAEVASRARMSVSTLKRLIAADVGPPVTRLGEGHSRILVREDAFNECSEGTRLHARLRPEHALLGSQDNSRAELAFLWLLPSAVDPLPEHAVARVVAALDARRVVAVRAGDAPAIEAARRAVLPLLGGGRA